MKTLVRLLGWIIISNSLILAQSDQMHRNKNHGGNWLSTLEYLEEGYYQHAVHSALQYLTIEPKRYQLVQHHFEEIARTDAGDPNILVFADSSENYVRTPVPERIDAIVTALRSVIVDSSNHNPLQAAMLLAAIAIQTREPKAGLDVLVSVADKVDVSAALYQFASRTEEAGFDEVSAQSYQHYAISPQGDPEYQPGSLLKQAELYERQGHHTLALAAYRQLVERFPNRLESSEAIYRQGRLLLHSFRDVVATRKLLQALTDEGRDYVSGSINLLLAECDIVANNLDAATERYRGLLAHSQTDWAARYGLGHLFYMRAEFDSAIAHFDTLISMQPGHVLTNDALDLVMLIESQRKLGHNHELAKFAASILLQTQGRIHQAEQARQGLLASPNDIKIRVLLDQAAAFSARAHSDSAIATYMKIIENMSDHREVFTAHVMRAQLLEKGNQLIEALKAYETTLLRFPDDAKSAKVRLKIQQLRSTFDATG